MSTGPTPDGLVNYLIYLVIGLCSIIFGSIQKYFNGRIAKVEERSESNSESIHSMQADLTEKMAQNNKDWGNRFERRRIENKEDFRLLHKKVEDGHNAILKEIRRLK